VEEKKDEPKNLLDRESLSEGGRQSTRGQRKVDGGTASFVPVPLAWRRKAVIVCKRSWKNAKREKGETWERGPKRKADVNRCQGRFRGGEIQRVTRSGGTRIIRFRCGKGV